jgi:hypothetical protein
MKKNKLVRVIITAAIAIAMVSPAIAAEGENILSLYAPKDLKGVPSLPYTGEKVTFTIPDLLPGTIAINPMQGHVGDKFTLLGKNLPANSAVTLTWSTASGAWLAEVQPNTVNYRGLKYDKWAVKMASVTTDANGSFTFDGVAAEDYGGPHDIYAVVNGSAVAKGGFQTNPLFKMTPSSGPVGTLIKVNYTGIGSSLYGQGVVALWDNGYAGMGSGLWTRGTMNFVIRASGKVGDHYLTVTNGLGPRYLNLRQSPVPYVAGSMKKFRVTKDNGIIAPSIEYPDPVAIATELRTTLSDVGVNKASTAKINLDVTSGIVGSKVKLNVTGLSATGVHKIVWSTVVGNRVNCPTSTCWVYAGVDLGSATPTNGNISSEITVPDNLGGWHVVQIKNGDQIEAQAPFYLKQNIFVYKDKNGKQLTKGIALADPSPLPESRDGAGTPTYTFKEGEDVTIALKGVGWTQFDNTMAVVYDNNYVGYGCGFNSNGYVVIHIPAVGGIGTHIIDLYPLYYTNQPSFTNTPYGMLPALDWKNNFPALALGYQQPAVHFSIKIVK